MKGCPKFGLLFPILGNIELARVRFRVGMADSLGVWLSVIPIARRFVSNLRTHPRMTF
jgi:hypothetical protein